jgi:3-phosphoshikimate 1-carboxyvinyltransferase
MDSSEQAAATRDLLRTPLDKLPDPLPLSPLPGPFHVTLRPPGSKSITNRLLVLAALCKGRSTLRGALVDADDAHAMLRGLAQLGVDIMPADDEEGARLVIDGVGGRPLGGATLQLGASGTSVRFLTGVAALADGPIIIDGDERMRERPISELTIALRAMQVRVEDLGERGFPPIRLHSQQACTGGRAHFKSPKSSQFVTALMLIAPWTEKGVEVVIEGEKTSLPYIRMTAKLLRAVGAEIEHAPDFSTVKIEPQPIEPFELTIEPDASGASYFWASAVLNPGSVCRVRDLNGMSLQGDARFVNVLGAMGGLVDADADGLQLEAPLDGEVIRGAGFSLDSMPDVAMTAASVACFADRHSIFTGLRTLRDKECDRLQAMETELRRIGAAIETTDDTIRIQPPDSMTDEPVEFETYNDHRMAMSLALIGLRRPNISIRNPYCVAKTYPSFWADLSSLYDAAL